MLSWTRRRYYPGRYDNDNASRIRQRPAQGPYPGRSVQDNFLGDIFKSPQEQQQHLQVGAAAPSSSVGENAAALLLSLKKSQEEAAACCCSFYSTTTDAEARTATARV
jgi:hypothetical protein